MRMVDIRKCLDVTVKCEAECSMDHMMVRVKLHFGRKSFKKEEVLEIERRGLMFQSCKDSGKMRKERILLEGSL